MRERLYRSRHDRMVFGVAGGLARYLKVDSSIVRIVWVLLFLAAGAGILLYIAAAVVVPEEPAGGVAGATGGVPPGLDRSPSEVRPMADGPIILGVVLVLVGGWLLAQRFLPRIDGDLVWPVVLLIIGVALLLGSLRGRRPG